LCQDPNHVPGPASLGGSEAGQTECGIQQDQAIRGIGQERLKDKPERIRLVNTDREGDFGHLPAEPG
jgi:hypothetical protein